MREITLHCFSYGYTLQDDKEKIDRYAIYKKMAGSSFAHHKDGRKYSSSESKHTDSLDITESDYKFLYKEMLKNPEDKAFDFIDEWFKKRWVDG